MTTRRTASRSPSDHATVASMFATRRWIRTRITSQPRDQEAVSLLATQACLLSIPRKSATMAATERDILDVMMEKRRYPRPSIREALLDLRVELPADISLEALADLQAGEERRYPVRNPRLQMHGRFTVGPQVA